jgi:tRNA-splicing ligase RtcB (3'-phosphate/5'-hydroxy nucleic acid ligase)
MNIKKINEVTWEIPKEGAMKVPGMIFVSEKLLEAIKEDKSIEQVKNVACMPGILKNSFAMPDMHMGYGFSIGGVAAFDFENGIITPGGIGFDINCLPKGTKIMTEYGSTKTIESFEKEYVDVDSGGSDYALKLQIGKSRLLSLDLRQKSFLSKDAVYFMKKMHTEPLYEIKTKLGYSIEVTGDHPILTRAGMTRAEELQECREIAVFPFKGVEYEPLRATSLLEEDLFSSQISNELIKRELLPLKLDNPKIPVLTRLFGFLLGDGLIYFSGEKGFICAYGEKDELEAVKEDFGKLGYSARIYSRKRQHSVPTKYGVVDFESESSELHVSSRSLAKLFCELGYPVGKKTSQAYLIPKWIKDAPLWIKRLFLSGYFGAELSKPRTHTKTGFDCPTVSINKSSTLLENAREFSIQLMQMLEEFNVRTHSLLVREDYFNKDGATHRLKIQISSDEDNLLNLFERIGFSYNRKRHDLAMIAVLYIKEKKSLTQIRKHIAEKIKELKNQGLTLNEVQKLLACDFANNRFVERHYNANAKQRITQGFVSFKEFCKQKYDCLEDSGALYDEIKSIRLKEYSDYVYDFNVRDTHNFIAENIIVSNCGVRLLATNLNKEDVEPKMSELLDQLFKRVPSGTGRDSDIKLTDRELEDVMIKGAKWAVEKGYGNDDDLLHAESNGTLDGAVPSKVSPKARARGRSQLGTLGAGNHFLEVQFVDEIYKSDVAEKFGITEKGQVVVMIHCGSRGFGHQICTDYLRRMEDEYADIISKLPEKDLAYAPFNSKVGQDYFGAMACAANYAWANRHIIADKVRKSFEAVFNDAKLSTVYDVAHNIAKIEEHNIDGERKKVIVHRKGATRCFPAGHPEVPEKYREVGHPVIIPGSMGTASFVMVGAPGTMDIAFGSTAHGAGRVMSRNEANRLFRGEDVKKNLEKKNIQLKSASWRGVSEEAPEVYKDIDEVVKVTQKAGISNPVARLRPMGVVKG